jgi:hypothetical protein
MTGKEDTEARNVDRKGGRVQRHRGGKRRQGRRAAKEEAKEDRKGRQGRKTRSRETHQGWGWGRVGRLRRRETKTGEGGLVGRQREVGNEDR